MSQQTPSALSRREFHAAVAFLAAAPVAAVAADEKPPADPGAALAAVAKARYAKLLTAEQVAEVESAVRGSLSRAEAMKRIKLTNGDEPAFAFSADV